MNRPRLGRSVFGVAEPALADNGYSGLQVQALGRARVNMGKPFLSCPQHETMSLRTAGRCRSSLRPLPPHLWDGQCACIIEV